MKQKTEKCPFCGGVMTPTYNAVYGNRKYHTIHSWECSRAGCQFNPDYFGGQGLEHRNLKKIMKMQNRITELEFDNRSLVEQMNKMTMRIEHKSETTQIEKEEKWNTQDNLSLNSLTSAEPPRSQLT